MYNRPVEGGFLGFLGLTNLTLFGRALFAKF